MQFRKLAGCTFAAAFLLAASLAAETTYAQPESGTPTSRAERKAARKQARLKRNDELRTLQKNGYNTQLPQQDYPESLQRAEQKSQGIPAASATAKTVPSPGSVQ